MPADDLAAARATIARLNRRAQQAEAIADRCVAGRPMTGPGLGRALANYAASRLAAVAQEALDEWADSLPYVDSYFTEKYGYAETMARLRATLATLTGGARATLPPMVPHMPKRTRTPPFEDGGDTMGRSLYEATAPDVAASVAARGIARTIIPWESLPPTMRGTYSRNALAIYIIGYEHGMAVHHVDEQES